MLQETVDPSPSSDIHAPKLPATARPKAQARAQPKPLSRQRTQTVIGSSPHSSALAGASMGSISSADITNTTAATASKASNYLPSWCQVTHLLLDGTSSSLTSTKASPAGSMPIWATYSLILRVKFELLFAYGMVHVHNKLENCDLESEPEWNASIKDGSLSKLMNVVFVARGSNEDEDALFYRSLLMGAFGLPET